MRPRRAITFDNVRPVTAPLPTEKVFVAARAIDALPYAAQGLASDWLDDVSHAVRDDAGWWVQLGATRQWRVVARVLGVR